MTREEQIRSKAKELGQKYFPDKANIWARGNIEAEYVESACIEMAKWADQHPHWIPVEEELPPPYCSNGSISDFVLTYNGYDVVKGYYDFMQNNWHNENYKVMEFNVTHWMPIVPPRKEDKE